MGKNPFAHRSYNVATDLCAYRFIAETAKTEPVIAIIGKNS